MRSPLAVILATLLLVGTCVPPGSALAQHESLTDLLPALSDVGSDASITAGGIRTLDEHAAAFIDPAEAAQLLTDWGWQAYAFRTFEGSQPTHPGAARPYLIVGIARYGSADGASAALHYVAENLRPIGAHREVLMPAVIGDESREFVAPVEGGTDLTLLVRSDSLVIGISVFLSDGNPLASPEQLAASILAHEAGPQAPTTGQASVLASLLDALPPDFPSCFRIHGEGVLDFPALVDRFPMMPDAAEYLEALGWETGAYREFICDDAPTSDVDWIDLSVHRFRDSAGAAAAVPYFAHARTIDTLLTAAPAMRLGDTSTAISGPSNIGTEYTLYLSTGPLLLRVTGVAPVGDPRPAVEGVMSALYERNVSSPSENRDPAPLPAPTATATRAPSIPSPTPTYPPLPTATAVPVPTLLPPPPTQPPVREDCDPSYPDVCIAPPPPDLDCRDVPWGDFRVIGADPHRLDGPYDGSNPYEPDGRGCEWN